MYYSGKARTMIDMDTMQNSTDLYSVDSANDYMLELALRDSQGIKLQDIMYSNGT